MERQRRAEPPARVEKDGQERARHGPHAKVAADTRDRGEDVVTGALVEPPRAGHVTKAPHL